jgi:rhomboid family GlyGly-CTERM serine protease
MIKISLKTPFGLALVLAVVILVLSFFDNALWTTSPDILDKKEYWRWFTSSLVHFGWPHSVMNIAGFLLITWVLFYQVSIYRFACLLMFCILVIGIAMPIVSEIRYYAGLSGAIHGLLIAGSFYAVDQAIWKRALVILVTLGKVIHEQLPGYQANDLQALMPVPVAVDAHLLGLIAGFIFVALDKIIFIPLTNKTTITSTIKDSK